MLSPPPMLRSAALLLALLATAASAQTQEVLFPGQSGEALLASIRAEYRPATLSGDNDDLYARIDSTTVDGQLGVIGVYTGLFVPFDGVPNDDPSQDVYNGGSPSGVTMNQEHTWPKAELNGSSSARSESDLHNLFPTQVGVNADRGNLPFADIPDNLTTRWYRGAPPYTQTSTPTEDIDEYSELRQNVSFEPREDHKGNVARALFYIEAMYPEETNEAWLEGQLETLYEWHYADPITEADQARSARVGAFQSGKDNPFVLDSTLVRRAFFPGITVDAEDAPAGLALRVSGPNPFRVGSRLALDLPAAATVRADVLDVLGRRVARLYDGAAPAGPLALRLDGSALAPGLYVVRASVDGAVLSRTLIRAR